VTRNEHTLMHRLLFIAALGAFLSMAIAMQARTSVNSVKQTATGNLLQMFALEKDTIPHKGQDSVDRALEAAMDSVKAGLLIPRKTSNNKKRLSFRVGLDFLTNDVYLGRSDTGRTATFLPAFTYTNKTGLYATSTLYYIPSHHGRKLDGGSLEVGYNIDFTPRFSGLVSFSHMFYAKTSTSIKSVMSSSLTTGLSYDANSIITPSVNLTYNFNRKDLKNDVLLDVGVFHDFVLTELFNPKDLATLSPSFNVNSGSQNFYEAYFQKIEAIKTKKGKSIKLTTVQLVYNKLITHTLEQGKKFQLLDYELAIPFIYIFKKFTFNLVPTMALPRNLLPDRLLKEISQQESDFYLQAGVSFKF